MNELKVKDLQEAYNDLHVREKNSYLTCVCPHCKSNEAFIYKNNPTLINCSRQNACGTKTKIIVENELSINDIKISNNFNTQQDYDTERLYNGLKYITDNTYDDKRIDFRGFSKETQIQGMISNWPLNALAKIYGDVFESKYKKEYYSNRNIIIPITKDNQVERLLLRSTDQSITPKEIQLVFKNEAKDFQEVINENSDKLYVAESVIDAFSFLEVDNKTSIIGLTGANRINKVSKYINENIDILKDKTFILAFDKDKAGYDTRTKFINVLEENEIKYIDFDMGQYKDPNDFLRADRTLFIENMSKLNIVNQNIISNNINTLNKNVNISRPDEISELLNSLEVDIKNAFRNPDSFRQLLSLKTNANNYSFTNLMFLNQQMNKSEIMSDNPIIVNTFQGWKEQGVNVLKGSKALSLILPGQYKAYKKNEKLIAVSKATPQDLELIEKGAYPTLQKTYFRIKPTVFHFTQTDYDISKDFKLFEPKGIYDNNEIEKMYINLRANIETVVPVIERNIGAIHGRLVTDNKQSRIIINSELATIQKIPTLLHEATHFEMEHMNDIREHNIIEIEAESVAYLLTKELGIENDFSFSYIKKYSSDKTPKELNKILSGISDTFNNMKNKYLNLNNCHVKTNEHNNINKSLSKDLNNDIGMDIEL